MPKVTDTRKQRAAELLKKVKQGPHFSTIGGSQDTPTEQYQRWAESWIVTELCDLVPELRKREG
jgi:hypothetical protein